MGTNTTYVVKAGVHKVEALLWDCLISLGDSLNSAWVYMFSSCAFYPQAQGRWEGGWGSPLFQHILSILPLMGASAPHSHCQDSFSAPVLPEFCKIDQRSLHGCPPSPPPLPRVDFASPLPALLSHYHSSSSFLLARNLLQSLLDWCKILQFSLEMWVYTLDSFTLILWGLRS